MSTVFRPIVHPFSKSFHRTIPKSAAIGEDSGISVPGTILARYVAGTGETAGGGGDLTEWQDQSGNGHHATQTGTDGPYRQVVDGGGAWDLGAGRFPLQFDGATGGMNIPSSLEVDTGDMAVLVIGRRNNSAQRPANPSLGTPVCLGDNSTGCMMWWSAHALRLYNNPVIYTEATEFRNTVIPTNPMVWGFQINRNGGTPIAKFIFGNRLMTIPVSDYTPRVTEGGLLGLPAQFSASYSEILFEVVILTGLNTDGSDLVTWANLMMTAQGQPDKTKALLIVGDSIVACLNTYQTEATIAELFCDDFTNAVVVGAAVSSARVYTTGDNHLDVQITNSGPILGNVVSATDGESVTKYTARVAVIWAGINDIRNGTSYANLRAGFISRISELTAMGATHIYVCTVVNATGQDAGMQTIRDDINTDILTDTAGLGHTAGIDMIDWDARFDDFTSALFDQAGGDQTHLTSLGVSVAHAAIKDAIEGHFA